VKTVRENEERSKKVKKTPGKNNVTADEVFRVCSFVHPRRERFRGRNAVVFDFEQNPAEKAHNRGESILRSLAGTVWIDEDAKGLLRLEARVKDSIKIGGGLLVSVQPGSSFVLEVEHVNGEVWLPAYAEQRINGRLFLFKGLKTHIVERFTDYRAFGIETSSDIQLPTP
jgi:hypothetical protein